MREMRYACRIQFCTTDGKYHFNGIGINGRKLLYHTLKTQHGRETCIHLSHDWDYRWPLTNMKINLSVLYEAGHF
jgi:hypothetical protein